MGEPAAVYDDDAMSHYDRMAMVQSSMMKLVVMMSSSRCFFQYLPMRIPGTEDAMSNVNADYNIRLPLSVPHV